MVVCWNDKGKIATALDSVYALREVRADPGFASVVVSATTARATARASSSRSATAGGCGSSRTAPTWASPRPATARSPRRSPSTSSCSTPTRSSKTARCARSSPSWTPTRAAGSPARASTTTTARCSSRVGEFDTLGRCVFALERLGRVAAAAPLRQRRGLARLGLRCARRVDLAIGAALAIRRALDRGDRRRSTSASSCTTKKSTMRNALAMRAGRRGTSRPAKRSTRAWAARAASTASRGASRRSRRKYWIKHHGPLWYYSLGGALVARYVLYAGALAGAVALGRRLRRG